MWFGLLNDDRNYDGPIIILIFIDFLLLLNYRFWGFGKKIKSKIIFIYLLFIKF